MSKKTYQYFFSSIIPILQEEIQKLRQKEGFAEFDAGNLFVHYQALLFLQEELMKAGIQTFALGIGDLTELSFTDEVFPEDVEDKVFQTILQSFVVSIKEQEQHILNRPEEKNDFLSGKMSGFYSILSTMELEADVSLDIEADILGLEVVELHVY